MYFNITCECLGEYRVDDEDAHCHRKDVKKCWWQRRYIEEQNAFKAKAMLRYLVFRILLFPLVTGLIIKHVKLTL